MTAATATTTAPARVRMTGLLRTVLLVDGLACMALGVGMLALNGWLATTLGVPVTLIVVLAAYLTLYGAEETFVATRESATPGVVVTLILLNAMWVLDSVILLAAGWFSPTTTGTVVFAVGAAGVLVVTLLQAYTYRRAEA